MKISKRLHNQIRLKNLLISLSLLCLIAALAWLSSLYSIQIDWTDNSRNTLSEASIKLLEKMPDEIQITAYVDAAPLFKAKAEQLVSRYQHYKANIKLNFIKPATQPEKIRELNIDKNGAIIVSYQWRTEKLMIFNEASVSSALYRLKNADERWITFLTGHGERSPYGKEHHDLDQFRKELQQRNVKTEILNLADIAAIPNNSALLVIASPTSSFLPEEIKIIASYIQNGGNLLWLTDPSSTAIPEVAEILGIHNLPGTIVDASSQLYGINDPSFIVLSKYPAHPINANFQTTTVYPISSALAMDDETNFQAIHILRSSKRSWTETGPISGTVRFDADSDEKEGPHNIALALTRDVNDKTRQRIIVLGDGDFLSNAYIGNVGNLDMGLKLINWLSHEDQLIDIPAITSIDNTLELSKLTVTVMAFGFMVILPLLFFITGFLIWRKRKKY